MDPADGLGHAGVVAHGELLAHPAQRYRRVLAQIPRQYYLLGRPFGQVPEFPVRQTECLERPADQFARTPFGLKTLAIFGVASNAGSAASWGQLAVRSKMTPGAKQCFAPGG